MGQGNEGRMAVLRGICHVVLLAATIGTIERALSLPWELWSFRRSPRQS